MTDDATEVHRQLGHVDSTSKKARNRLALVEVVLERVFIAQSGNGAATPSRREVLGALHTVRDVQEEFGAQFTRELEELRDLALEAEPDQDPGRPDGRAPKMVAGDGTHLHDRAERFGFTKNPVGELELEGACRITMSRVRGVWTMHIRLPNESSLSFSVPVGEVLALTAQQRDRRATRELMGEDEVPF